MVDFLANGRDTSRLALAHRRADVKSINDTIRAMRKAGDDLKYETTYKTEHGLRAFAPGDRLLFTKNDHDLGIKNGTPGTVAKAGKRTLTIELDDCENADTPGKVSFQISDYDAINHGYATTIHKSQGATVVKSFVLASKTLDRHLTYVALTRHKKETRLYAGNDEFKSAEKLGRSLGRMRQKQSTLDFGFDATPKCRKKPAIQIEPSS